MLADWFLKILMVGFVGKKTIPSKDAEGPCTSHTKVHSYSSV